MSSPGAFKCVRRSGRKHERGTGLMLQNALQSGTVATESAVIVHSRHPSQEVAWAMRIIVICFLSIVFAAGLRAQEKAYLSESFEGSALPEHSELPSLDAYGPVDTQTEWLLEKGRLVGRSPRWPWSQMVLAGGPWGDTALSVDLCIVRQTGNGPGWGGETYKRFWNDENLRGFDAAILLRYESPRRFYRVQFASRTGEVALWKPSAGIINVGRCDLEQGRTYRVSLQVAGKRVRVGVEGKCVLDYLDPQPGPQHGRVGFGVCNSEVAFDNLKVTRLERSQVGTWPVYPDRPDFSYGPWQQGFAMFDRGEPVCWVDPVGRYIHRVKLRRGGPPLFMDFASWKAVPMAEEWRKKPMEVQVEEQGAELRLKFVNRYDDNASSFRTLRLSYEPESGRYIYDWDTTLTFKDPTSLAPGYWRAEFIDPIWYNAWGPPGKVSRPWPCGYSAGLISGPDGKPYRRPLNHDSNRGRQTITYLSGRKTWSGLFAALDLSPVVEVEDVEGRGIYTEMCHAFYDFHYIFTGTQSAKEAAPRYRVRFRYIGYPHQKSSKLLENAQLHPSFDNSRQEVRSDNYWNALSLHGAFNLEYPFCTAPVNRFSNLVTIADTYSGRGWYGNYTVDKMEGYDDSVSLRFDGPCAAYGYFGKDHGFDPLTGRRLIVEFLMKTKRVAGDGLHVAVGQGWQRWEWERHLVTGVTGDSDWQPVRFIFEPGQRRSALMLVLKMNGNGTVWVDDLSIRSLADGERPGITPGTAKETPSSHDLVLDLHCDEGSGPGTLDHSGCGNGGLLMGPEWVRDGGRWALRFDGENDYVMIPHANSLNPRDRATLEIWVKPEANTGHFARLIGKYFYLLFGLGGDRGPYEVEGTFYANERATAKSPRKLQADAWHHLAQTYDGAKVRLFVDGAMVAEANLSGEIAASLYPMFIGTYLPNERNQWYKGLIGGVRMYWRALSADEIADHAARGLPR